MKILVIGGGGREHAIIKKIKENPQVEAIYALPGNGGIAMDAFCVDIKATDLEGIKAFVQGHPVDYAIVAPDDPLVLGCVDMLQEMGIPCFGPEAKAAIIEGSKVFSKDLMKKYGIPTAKYETFDDNIERAKLSGVKYIAEPGGSVRDDLVIGACDKYGMVMAFTGMRLFHH